MHSSISPATKLRVFSSFTVFSCIELGYIIKSQPELLSQLALTLAVFLTCTQSTSVDSHLLSCTSTNHPRVN